MENEVKEVKKETKKTAPKKQTKPKAPVKTKIDPKTGTLKVVPSKSTAKGSKTTKKASTKTTTKKETTKKEVVKKTTPKKKTPKETLETVETTSSDIIKTPRKRTTPIVLPSLDEKVPVVTEVKEDVTETPLEIKEEQTVENNESIENPVENPTIVEEQIETPQDTQTLTTDKEPQKRRGRKPSDNPLPKKSSRELTIEPPKREPKVEPKKEEKKPVEPVVIVRPTPKKPHNFTKEEKVIYKKLQEAFNYVANLTNVIEERTMDTKLIPDLTVGELHVMEAVDKNNNKPMTLIAKELKVTVGSLTISLNRLVQKGYLLRTRHEMDHRIILVSITPKGKKALKTHDAFHDTILGLVLDSLTLKQTYTVMNQFALVLENYFDPKTIGKETPKKGSKK